MAACLQQVGTALEVVGTYSETCTGFVLATAEEYALTPTLAQIFATPDAETITAAFMAGMALPLILWLSAWGFGSVVAFIDRRTDSDVIIHD